MKGEEYIPLIVDKLKKADPSKIILFGSHAYGKPTAWSDVDLLVVMETPKGELETVKSKYFQHEQTKYLPRREADISVLNAREIKHIDEVLVRLSDKNAKDLSDYSHEDIPWLITKENEVIKYEAVFYRTKETSVREYE